MRIDVRLDWTSTSTSASTALLLPHPPLTHLSPQHPPVDARIPAAQSSISALQSSLNAHLSSSPTPPFIDAPSLTALKTVYLTPQLIICTHPHGSSPHPTARALSDLLSLRHPLHAIYNMSEQPYPTSSPLNPLDVTFKGLPFPPLGKAMQLLIQWSSLASKSGVIVLHCLNGSGRTLCTAAALLSYAGLFNTPGEALSYVCKHAKRSDTLPSQVRRRTPRTGYRTYGAQLTPQSFRCSSRAGQVPQLPRHDRCLRCRREPHPPPPRVRRVQGRLHRRSRRPRLPAGIRWLRGRPRHLPALPLGRRRRCAGGRIFRNWHRLHRGRAHPPSARVGRVAGRSDDRHEGGDARGDGRVRGEAG